MKMLYHKVAELHHTIDIVDLDSLSVTWTGTWHFYD